MQLFGHFVVWSFSCYANRHGNSQKTKRLNDQTPNNKVTMKVLKFGGTSVGSVESILSLKQIVEQASAQEPVVVVVSALGGVTDKLLAISQLAFKHDEGYKAELDALVVRHHEMISAVVPTADRKAQAVAAVDALLEQLRSILYGVYLIHDLSAKTQDAIVAYGERLSSQIVAALVDGAQWYDSRNFIKTTDKLGRHTLDADTTYRLVRETLTDYHVALVPGFIAKDVRTGETTNLGRGGSDYTAAIIAAALGARQLEIWTDVDGFMTADPRVISSAYPIKELSYVEAMELCNFGAKVIYPPTIYPVCVKNIPIKVKNTFNPSAPGTIIKKEIAGDHKPIKGISSIGGTSLITVTGLSMVGVIGVNRRIFTALADAGISVFMVSQASSENSTSVGVKESDADAAAAVLNQEFGKEIETGAMYPMIVEKGLATIAIVGENMKKTPGIAGKLFGTLGRSGISVIACAQGASETNISFVVQGQYLRKSLNVLHDSFFLSEYKVLNLFVCGVGTVGSKLLEQIRKQYDSLKQHSGLCVNVVGIASSKRAIYRREGLDLASYREALDAAPTSTPQTLLENIVGMNIFNAVFVDCTASYDVAALYQPLLEHNVSVVAANKIAASGNYDTYRRLKDTARSHGVKFRFETNVGAGLPIINTINDLRHSGDKILKIEAVLSGTLNYIFNALAADTPFSQTVHQAQELGFAEPDPRIDLSGMDVVRKLVILTREAGYRVEQDDVEKHLFVPDDMFRGTVDEFWQRLPALDADFEAKRQALVAKGCKWRFVARMEVKPDGTVATSVGLQEIPVNHSFYELEGSNNIITLNTERYRDPMLIQGFGAGASVTAAGVFANVLSIANI